MGRLFSSSYSAYLISGRFITGGPSLIKYKHTVIRMRYQSTLARLISDDIRITGPMPISTYMQYALYHPVYGYYANAKHSDCHKGFISQEGDFITSPEVSQLFGEASFYSRASRTILWHNISPC